MAIPLCGAAAAAAAGKTAARRPDQFPAVHHRSYSAPAGALHRVRSSPPVAQREPVRRRRADRWRRSKSRDFIFYSHAHTLSFSFALLLFLRLSLGGVISYSARLTISLSLTHSLNFAAYSRYRGSTRRPWSAPTSTVGIAHRPCRFSPFYYSRRR